MAEKDGTDFLNPALCDDRTGAPPLLAPRRVGGSAVPLIGYADGTKLCVCGQANADPILIASLRTLFYVLRQRGSLTRQRWRLVA